MGMVSSPRGVFDILPDQSWKWQHVEEVARELAGRYGYREIRTPIFEHTELFVRSVGETTDIVEKEMYTFSDRSGRSLTLRPEGTAGVVRAYLQHSLHKGGGRFKAYYIGPMFRYDRPQAGRYRQFHQFGIELFGVADPLADAEVIALGYRYLQRLGLRKLQLEVNSIGCPRCRPAYRRALVAAFTPASDQLCADCARRLHRNPLRVLDCKRRACRRLTERAPAMRDFLCDQCREHFATTCRLLEAVGIPHRVNDRLVRGLDYYTRTVFEIVYPSLGAQSSLCAGGRYDGLVEACGGEPTPGVGFGLGLERVLLAMEKEGVMPQPPPQVDAFVAAVGEVRTERILEVGEMLRQAGVAAELGEPGRSLKSQMRRADRLGARWVVILGEEELGRETVSLRDMLIGEQREVPLATLVRTILEGSDSRREANGG